MTLPNEIRQQIENEAIDGTKDRAENDFSVGWNQGYERGYEGAGAKYAEKWQDAEQRADRYEKALKAIAKPIAYLQQKAEEEGASLDGYFAQELARSAAFLQSLADEALTPKTSTDDTANG